MNIGNFGTIFGAAIGVDTNPPHSPAGLVYASDSQGNGPATIYQYDVATNTSRIYATQGQMPPAGTAEATVYCTLTCTRPADPDNPPGAAATFRFAQGLFVDPRADSLGGGSVYLAEDSFAGTRSQRGHMWVGAVHPVPLRCDAGAAAHPGQGPDRSHLRHHRPGSGAGQRHDVLGPVHSA